MDAVDPPTVHDGGLASSLDAARERAFVGRAVELASFADALDESSSTRIVYVHGAGGMGKTTFLDACARHARDRHRESVYLDARDVECTAEAVTTAIAERSTPQHAGRPTSPRGPSGPTPEVLLIDGYELLAPLDRWFRQQFLPMRPRGSVTVVAARPPPAPDWWTDPGWRHVVRVHELSGFDAAESHELLTRMGVPDADREGMARLAHGHPLVLALLAEAGRSAVVPTDLADAPDVVNHLCRLIIDDIPDAAHRSGLATCAHATRMTQDLLTHTIGARSDEVWRWLETRPYVRRGSVGLFLHDVVRELFEAEFAQRSPDAYVSLHRAVRGYFLRRLVDPAEPHPDRAAAEILLLHRKGPLAAQTATLRQSGLLSISHAAPEDHEGIFELVERGEGKASGRLARAWVADQPQSLYRARSDAGVEAFAMQVYIPTSAAVDIEDPVVAAAVKVVEERGPLRPGERININRFAGGTGSYQRDPLVLLVNGVSCILEWAHHPAAWTFITTFEADYYGPYFEYLGMSAMFGLDVDGLNVTGYGWDRRRFPVTALFELMARRELSGETGPPPRELMRPAPLSRSAFERGVREALPQLSRPDRLADSPLQGSRLVDPSSAHPAAELRAVMLGAIASMGSEPRGAEHRRVLERTYLKGARSQEAAAELLGLPFSTYRRHLAQAHDRLVEVLWSVEISERAPEWLDTR